MVWNRVKSWMVKFFWILLMTYMFVSTATRGAASPAAGTTSVAQSLTAPRTSPTVAAPSARYLKYSELYVLHCTTGSARECPGEADCDTWQL